VIAFATLLLGLIVGPQPVELLVGESVVSVELILDGRSVATLEAGDWSATCDFGQRLEPHELVAVAYDSEGKEVGRDRQWINMPRRPAEASIALEAGQNGTGLVAHLTWESIVDAEPERVTATFDGRPLQVVNRRRIELPPFDPDQLHHLRVELDFSGNVSSVVEATFAGTYVDRVNTELTAVPVALGKRPDLAGLSDRFTKNAYPLTLVAIERGPAEVVVVRDEAARRDLDRRLRNAEEKLWRRAHGGSVPGRGLARTKLPLAQDLNVRFLWPVSERQERSDYDLAVFPPSKTFTSDDGGLLRLLTHVRQPFSAVQEDRFADAVAAAALLASERNRRRAVLLIIGSDSAFSDTSQFDVPSVSRFLDLLGVPLVVWTTANRSRFPPSWGRPVEISSLKKLERAAAALFSMLEQQRIVWLEGAHLPQDVALDASELDLHLVRQRSARQVAPKQTLPDSPVY
jgi:hypothetical protein